MRAVSVITAALLTVTLTTTPNVASAAEPQPIGQPPPKGNALHGWGIFGITFGILGVVGGTVMIPLDPAHAGATGAVPLAFGAGFVALGALGVHYGKIRKQRYARWTVGEYVVPPPVPASAEAERPPRGLGLTINGAIGLAAGVTVGSFAVSLIRYDEYRDDPGMITLLAGSAVAVASGIPMFVIGSIRMHRHRMWEQRQRGIVWTPTPWIGPRAVGLGFVGRF